MPERAATKPEKEIDLKEAQIGVIGGSGLYAMEGLTVLFERTVETPFGEPSDPFVIGEMGGVRVAFLSRHGRGHRLLPSEINYRANIFAFKSLGVDTIVSISAVGSMKEEYRPTDIVLPHQFIDRTRHRPDTFFGNGIVAHVSFADPICAAVSFGLSHAARQVKVKAHIGGVYLCMEGPQFSTRAESNLYRSWGVDVIGMTNLPEAKLAREAEICYATIAMITDYDCWRESDEAVTVGEILGYLETNAETAITLIREAIPQLAARERECLCLNALQNAIITDRKIIPAGLKETLAPIIGKYV